MIEDETDVLETWYAEVGNEYDFQEYEYYDEEEEQLRIDELLSFGEDGDLYVDPDALAVPDEDREDWENARRYEEEEAELLESSIPRELPAIEGYWTTLTTLCAHDITLVSLNRPTHVLTNPPSLPVNEAP
eukprot:1175912-Prorocentrum_minimum.AAC.2